MCCITTGKLQQRLKGDLEEEEGMEGIIKIVEKKNLMVEIYSNNMVKRKLSFVENGFLFTMGYFATRS